MRQSIVSISFDGCTTIASFVSLLVHVSMGTRVQHWRRAASIHSKIFRSITPKQVNTARRRHPQRARGDGAKGGSVRDGRWSRSRVRILGVAGPRPDRTNPRGRAGRGRRSNLATARFPRHAHLHQGILRTHPGISPRTGRNADRSPSVRRIERLEAAGLEFSNSRPLVRGCLSQTFGRAQGLTFGPVTLRSQPSQELAFGAVPCRSQSIRDRKSGLCGAGTFSATNCSRATRKSGWARIGWPSSARRSASEVSA